MVAKSEARAEYGASLVIVGTSKLARCSEAAEATTDLSISTDAAYLRKGYVMKGYLRSITSDPSTSADNSETTETTRTIS